MERGYSRKVLITAALPYINGPPHLGHIVGSHLPADIFARFKRMCGKEVLFLGGTDEHGTPIELSAQKNNIELKKFKEIMRNVHKKIYEKFEISYDIFGNTSSKYHEEFVKKFFLRLYERGFIKEGKLEMFYCNNCERFLPGRYVEGVCKYCGYEHANGDQCENCGRNMDVHSLLAPKCKICGETPVIKRSKHLFFRLSLLKDQIKEFLDEIKERLSKHTLNFSYSWLEQGLKDRCITRDIKNGIPVPLPGWKDKVFYVWFDALLGYISFIGEKFGEKGIEKWWKDKNVRIYQFLGKDNIPFHTIFWPAMLIAHGEFNLPYNIVGLNYLLFEGRKFSKSKKIGVFCDRILESDIDIEALRFYLSFLIPETSDTSFSWEEFKERVNKDLIGNIANFIWRALHLSKHVEMPLKGRYDDRVWEDFLKYAKEYLRALENVEIKKALNNVISCAKIANTYLNETEPWKEPKNSERCKDIIYNTLEMSRILAIMMYPFTPSFSKKVMNCLGLDEDAIYVKNISLYGERYERVTLPDKPFFKRISDEDIRMRKNELSKSYSIKEIIEKFGGQ